MQISLSEYMQALLHNISQALLIPTMVILALCVAFSVYSIGSILVEYFTSRLHYKVNMPDFLARIAKSPVSELEGTIEKSGMLYKQRYALIMLTRYLGLPEESRVSLAKRMLANVEQRYDRAVGRTDTLAKISPMLGLMGTLIPLGPGIVALGQGQTDILSNSLMIAFDTTVIGLVSSVVCFVISRIRRAWYEDYVVSMEAALTAVLEKASEYKGSAIADMSDAELDALAPAPKGLLARGRKPVLEPPANTQTAPAEKSEQSEQGKHTANGVRVNVID